MLPKSVTNMGFNLIGLLGFFVALIALRNSTIEVQDLTKVLILLASTALPILFCEVLFAKCYSNPSSGLNFSVRGSSDPARVVTKLIGLYGILGLLALIYFVFPEYNGSFYNPYYNLLKIAVPLVMLLAVPYFFMLDRYLVDPKDAYWQFGRALMLKRDFAKDNLQLFLGWLVKGFFLPLMFVYFSRDLNFLLNFNLADVSANFSSTFDFLFHFLFSLDLLFVSFGYMCTFRIFDSHIRSTEPTALGWGCALLCYQPFWNFFSGNYLSYGNNSKPWGYWWAGSSMYFVWGTVILVLLGIYLWATLSFGVRFSNLTHRGIITNGPYRFTKHPAYISKNLAWWMISMPFMVSTNFADSFRHSVLLLGLNLIYFLRARTEERHLSQDPVYRQYKEYIAQHGLFAFGKKEKLVLQGAALSLESLERIENELDARDAHRIIDLCISNITS